MKQKIYDLKSDVQSRFSIGIACRNQNDQIAGLFVNTEPHNSVICRESEFQARKFELLITQEQANKVLNIANAYHKKESLPIFESAQEVIQHIRSLKEAEASKFTRISSLSKLNPDGWINSKKYDIMYNIQKDFIKNGEERGAEYAITALALYNLGIGIIESSSTDSYWGVKARYVHEIGKGANELGTIHTIIGKELKEAAKNAHMGKLTYNGIQLDLNIVEEKQKEIEEAKFNGKLNIMSIKYNNDMFNTIVVVPAKYHKQVKTEISKIFSPSLIPKYPIKKKGSVTSIAK